MTLKKKNQGLVEFQSLLMDEIKYLMSTIFATESSKTKREIKALIFLQIIPKEMLKLLLSLYYQKVLKTLNLLRITILKALISKPI